MNIDREHKNILFLPTVFYTVSITQSQNKEQLERSPIPLTPASFDDMDRFTPV